MDFIGHPTCSTCRRARQWLDNNQIEYTEYDIRKSTPSKAQFLKWFKETDYQTKQFFNTSGQKYRDLGLKDVVGDLDDDKRAELLASDGMIIKRPLLVESGKLLAIGFNEDKYLELFGKTNEEE